MRAVGSWKTGAPLGLWWSRKLSGKKPVKEKRGVGKNEGISSNQNSMWKGSEKGSGELPCKAGTESRSHITWALSDILKNLYLR